MSVHPSIHQSVCPHLGGIPWPGPARGYPSQVQLGGTPCWGVRGYPLPGGTPPWVPPIRPGWGYPVGGYPNRGYPTSGTPHQTWPGGVPQWGYPDRGSPPQVPPSDLAGGTPPWVPPHQTWLGGYPDGGKGNPPWITDGVLDMPRSVCLLRSRRRTFLC